jgi:hypothetical protein
MKKPNERKVTAIIALNRKKFLAVNPVFKKNPFPAVRLDKTPEISSDSTKVTVKYILRKFFFISNTILIELGFPCVGPSPI